MDTNQEKTIFEKIATRILPAQFIYEDEICCAINDIQPQAPVHILVFPKKHIARLSEAKAEDKNGLGHLLWVVQQIAEQQKLDKGFRVVINNGLLAGETVPHLHIHLLAGRQLGWPPG